MRLSDLNNAQVVNANGKSLGRVHEVHICDGRIQSIAFGATSFLERMTGRQHSRTIDWGCIGHVGKHLVRLRVL